jgi:hypothetical protein
VFSYDGLYKFKVDPEVLVDDHIPECNNLRPWDLRMSLASFRRNASARLAQQGQPVLHRALKSDVAEEVFPPAWPKSG